MREIGVVVNPIAGMGGRVGLKGTDGLVEEARALGGKPRSPERALEALISLRERAPDAAIFTYAGSMGEDAAREAGFEPTVIGEPDSAETSAADTRAAVRELVTRRVDLILFVGGDGTAVDVAETLSALDSDVPILGVPAGVKIYSSVFAVTPRDAGRIAASFDDTEGREVSDIDEDAYREGEVRATLKAVARVPVASALQSGKQLAGGTVETLASGFADDVRTSNDRRANQNPERSGDAEAGTTYVLGPGSTVGEIKSALGFEGSPLGVDVWRDGAVLARDASEAEILSHLGDRNVVVVSPIGGQGFIFGRGNHQLSPAVLRRSDVEIVASKSKLDEIGVLRVDTGDEAVDEALRGWVKVRVGRFERRMMKVV